ncbi:MAG: GtrA family protein [Dysgonomonas sp.]|nr:GtrA family protein [Dysgonomonas sp.]
MKQLLIDLSKKKSVRELFKYGLVGLVGLIIDAGLFFLLAKKFAVEYPFAPYIQELLGGKMSLSLINADVSHVISSVLAITNNFILNSYFTFKVTDNKVKRFFSFAGVAAIGLVISTTLMTVFIGKLHLDEMVAKILSIIIVAAIQFIINKFFTFKEK